MIYIALTENITEANELIEDIKDLELELKLKKMRLTEIAKPYENV